MKSTKLIIDQFNEFNGQAMITVDSKGLMDCTVGQNECFTEGYTVIASKNLKEDKEFYLTYENMLEILGIPNWKKK